MIGKKLAHYEILEKLGAGGMGEVYRARDTKLGREVAIKVLPPEMAQDPERRTRFQREAMAVAALQHPNIVTIFAVEEVDGILFLAMELVQGQSLDRVIPPQGMNLPQLLDIAIPVAEAVSFAHEKGITHRDLKPANIVLDESGRPRVLDFGLAKLLEVSESSDAATLAGDGSVTKEGVVLGTASYMSPEQAEGKPTDARSDVFSLGIILFEMASGRKPFQGETTISTISSILKDTPPTVTDLNRSLPNHLGRVVNRCLAKDPERRYQVAKDLKNELAGLKEESSGIAAAPVPVQSTGKPSGIPRPVLLGAGAVVVLAAVLGIWKPWSAGNRSVPTTETGVTEAAPAVADARPRSDRMMAVVFPFENLGPADQAYFAAGVTEEITSRLSAVSGLGVISRTSAVQYDRSGKTMRQIGEDLGVDYVLDGTVRWAKSAAGTGRVRITPQLIRVEDDTQMWSETYDREMDDIFAVQTDIAGHVIDQLGVKLLGHESEVLEDTPTENLEAYQAYLQAIDLSVPSLDEYDAGRVELLEKAVELDPGFLAAWYRLSRHHSDWYRNADRTEARLARAKAALQGAEGADPQHPFTRLARGYYYYYGFRDYDRALAEFTAALEARPNDAEAQRSIGYILRRQGDLEGSNAALELALELDPQNSEGLSNLASSYEAMRRFDKALPLQEQVIELGGPGLDNEIADLHGMIIGGTGDLARARAVLRPEPIDVPILYSVTWFTQSTYERDFESALRYAKEIEESENPLVESWRVTLIGLAEAELGQTDSARGRFERAAKFHEELLDQAPSNAAIRVWLSTMYALLGREAEAIREAKLAVDLTAKDAFSGPQQLENLAVVYGMTGRGDEAIELLDRLLTTPYEDALTLHRLRLDPRWDPLRDHPGFETLFEKHGQTLP